MSLHRFARLRALIPLLAGLGIDLRTPEPVPDIGEAERVMRELAAAGISAPEVDHAAGGPENFLKVARVCLEMQAALRKLGIETVNVERLLLHDRMVRAQQDFGRRYGPLAGAGMALGLPVVQGLADYEARCAKEAALCGCGPADDPCRDRRARAPPRRPVHLRRGRDRQLRVVRHGPAPRGEGRPEAGPQARGPAGEAGAAPADGAAMNGDTLTAADIRAAAVTLAENAMPTFDGFYIAHVSPQIVRALREAAIDARVRPARHFASWAAVVGENLRGVLRAGYSFDAGWGTVDIDEDDRADAIQRLWLAWRRVAARRRATRRRRRGW